MAARCTLSRKAGFICNFEASLRLLRHDFIPSASATTAGKGASAMMQKTPFKKGQDRNQTGDNRRQGQGGQPFNIFHPKLKDMDPGSIDWVSVYPSAQMYNPDLVPLPIRMGRNVHNKVEKQPCDSNGNEELLKVPNFFHLTPPAIKRHCQALKEFTTPWPKDIGKRPLRISSTNYLFSGPSLRHPDSHKVKLQVYLKDLVLDDHAREKLIELVENRHDPENDELTIVADKCPTRKQNQEYALYLLNVLYEEAWTTEPWEVEKNEAVQDEEEGRQFMGEEIET